MRKFCGPSKVTNYETLNPRVMMIPVAEDPFGALDGDDSSYSLDTNRLVKAVSEESLEAVESLLTKGTPVNGHGGAFNETPLHIAAQQGWTRGLKLLLSKGANAQSVNQFGQTPLHYASASKASECVRSLLDHSCQATLDHKDMRGHTPLHDAAAAGFSEGVVLHLKAGANVNVRDKNEETPLHKAAKASSVSSILALLNKGADLGARDKGGESVLTYILRHLPAGMDALLDHCLIPDRKKLSSKKLEVTLNFIPVAGSSEMNQMKTLNDIVDLGHPKLLLHPVCEAFLLLKWHNVRKLFFIEVIFYFVLAILATLLILDKFVWQRVNGTIPEMIPRKVFSVFQIIVFIQASLILLKQVLTLIQGVRAWIFSFWHVLNSIIPIFVLMVLPGSQTAWQHHFATVTLLLIWVLGMLHIGRFPGCGIYVSMFTRVAKVFLRIFLIFFCLLLAFSLSFYVTKFSDQYNVSDESPDKKIVVDDKVYSDPIMTFIKTLTMMIGELDFDSEFVDQLRGLPGTSHVIYLVFVILVSIILANLLVALAVNDVQGLRNSAHLERLIKQMELVFQMEKTFSSVSQLALLVKCSCLHIRIKKWVHDFSSIKIFVQPYHPQKSSKMMVVEGRIMHEINLRQNHVSKLLECLRLREEESASAGGRKLSLKKSRPTLSEYSSFANCEDNMFDILKAIERNILDAIGEKVEEVTSAVSVLSTRMKVLEEVVLKGTVEYDDRNISSSSRADTSANTHHLYNPSIRRLQPKVHSKTCNQRLHQLNTNSTSHQTPLHRHSYHLDQIEDQEEASQSFQEPKSISSSINCSVQLEMAPQRTVSLPMPPPDISNKNNEVV